MTEKKHTNRRSLLKILPSVGIAGSAAYWTKPAIQSVVLPAHAQTSSGTVVCTASIRVSDMNDSSNLDMAVLAFDPDTGGCRMEAVASVDGVSDISGFMGNVISGIDAGSVPAPNWDHEVVGDTNWSVTPALGDDNTSEGTFNLVATRIGGASNGQQYDVALNISLSGTNNVEGIADISAVIRQR